MLANWGIKFKVINIVSFSGQRTNNYPSGLPWKSNSGDYPERQPYKYGGKEFVEMHGLDEYDSDAQGGHNNTITQVLFCFQTLPKASLILFAPLEPFDSNTSSGAIRLIRTERFDYLEWNDSIDSN